MVGIVKFHANAREVGECLYYLFYLLYITFARPETCGTYSTVTTLNPVV